MPDIDGALWQSIESALPAYLDRQRWYADKLRPIRDIGLLDIALDESGAVALCLLQIQFDTGEPRTYFVPMTFAKTSLADRWTITGAETPDGYLFVHDAIGDPRFREYLIDCSAGKLLRGRHGVFSFEPWQIDGSPIELRRDLPSVTMAFEQSNSSIAFGEVAMAKLYRRLEPGHDIEVEMNRYLAVEAGFDSVPNLLGAATYQGTAGQFPIMLVQQHVGDHRDCWSELTERLRHRVTDSLDLVRGLGTVTGRMHVALASAPPSSPLHPVRIERADVEAWTAALADSAQETARLTRARLISLPERSHLAARAFLESGEQFSASHKGLEALVGTYQTRVHGDYHLGQVLVTRDGRLLIVDFEGEPNRPAHQRRARYPPLKDVAGMLRSLDYATAVVSSTLDVQAEAESRAWLRSWEHAARMAFLEAYRTSAQAAPIPIMPAEDTAFLQTIAALEADKALYEVRYELSSRPDWAWVPLEALVSRNSANHRGTGS